MRFPMTMSTMPTAVLGPSPDQCDTWRWWPMGSMIGVWFLFAFLDGIPGSLSFMLIPVSVLSLFLAGMTLIIVVCVFLAQRRIRRAISLALALILPFVFRAPINRAADCLHLAMMLKYGFGVLTPEQARSGALIGRIPPPVADKKSSAAFDWSVGLAGGTNTFLLYDLKDEIALPLSQHKHPASQGEDGFEQRCAGESTHLFGHYYVCDIN